MSGWNGLAVNVHKMVSQLSNSEFVKRGNETGTITKGSEFVS
jgi:hypothetical protein